MASAWGLSWGSAWGNSWGDIGAVVVPPVPIIPPGSGGAKRKKLHVRLTTEEIRRLREKGQKRRRTIWERPKPEEVPREAPREVPPAAKAVAYVDHAVLAEAVEMGRAVVDLARARIELEAERRAREAVAAEEMEARRAAMVAELQRLEEARLRDEEEAILVLLMAA